MLLTQRRVLGATLLCATALTVLTAVPVRSEGGRNGKQQAQATLFVVSAAFALLLAKIRYAGEATYFDVAVVFCSIALYAACQGVFFQTIVGKLQVQLATATLQEAVDVDPTGRLRQYMQQRAATESASSKEAERLQASNARAMARSAPATLAYACAAVGVLALGVHGWANLSAGRAPLLAREAAVLVLLTSVFLVELLLYVCVISQVQYYRKTDVLRKALDAAGYTLSWQMINLWNGSPQLRAGIEKQTDIRGQVADLTSQAEALQGLCTDAASLVPGLPPAQQQPAETALTALDEALSVVAAQLQRLADDPCNPNLSAKQPLPAGTAGPWAKLVNLSQAASALNRLAAGSPGAQPAPAQVTMKALAAQTQQLLPQISQVALLGHCNTREETRKALQNIRQTCLAAAAQPERGAAKSLLVQALKSPNAVLILISTLAVGGWVVGRLASRRQWFDIAALGTTCAALVAFQLLFVGYVQSGAYSTILQGGAEYLFTAVVGPGPSR